MEPMVKRAKDLHGVHLFHALSALLFLFFVVYPSPTSAQTSASLKAVRPEEEPVERIQAQPLLRREVLGKAAQPRGRRRAPRPPHTDWYWDLSQATEWDNNIFLDGDNEKEDFRFIETVAATMEHVDGDWYVRSSGLFRMNHYADLDVPVNEEQLDARIAYRPGRGVSLGLQDTFLRISQGTGQSAQADRILQLGFNINQLSTSLRIPLGRTAFIGADYGFEVFDFHDIALDDFLDRNRHRIGVHLGRSLGCSGSARLGYSFRDSDFKKSFVKDSGTHELFLELERRLWGVISWTNRAGFERKNFDEGKNTGKPAVRSSVQATFSRRFSASTGYEFQPQVESSRSDFRQYRSNRAWVELRRLLRPSLIGSMGFSVEHQDYTPGDRIVNSDPVRRSIDLVSLDVNLDYHINHVWTLGVGYRIARRSAEFSDESYRNNVSSIRAAASW